MRVIKPGRLPEKRLHRIACRTCHAQFEFEQHEAKYVSDFRDGDYLEINCPTCGNTCTVATKTR